MIRRFLSLSMLAACAVTPPADELGDVEQALGGQCPIWQCGSNSPNIDNYDFHDLHKYGLTNSAGFRIASFTKNSPVGIPISYALDVGWGQLVGRDNHGNQIWGQALVGAKILLVNDRTNRQFLVRVMGVGSVPFWATPHNNTHPSRETYVLDWVLTVDGVNPAPNHRYINVCKLASQVDPDNDLMGMPNGYHSVLFEGERIDAGSKTISQTLDYNWFNIGCAGHALAKLELTGHTFASSGYGFSSTIDERQTILKMFVADYTGTGVPFTIAGMPLSWADDHGTMQHQQMITSIESRWTPKGAICLDEPRTKAHFSQKVIDAFPDTSGDVVAAMGDRVPPHCKNPDWNQLDGYHLVTADPL
jgi:hypothetical protein